MLNLAINVRDTKEDGGTLAFATRTEDIGPTFGDAFSAGRYLRLDVTGTGVGMDEETLAQAVEPFYSTKIMGKGTGMGLSMVHGLALQSGGVFRATRVVGTGTTATLWLPNADGSPSRLALAKPEAPAASRTATLLLVDDEQRVLAQPCLVL